MPAQWYVLHVKPHKERSVHRQLSLREEMDVFFPSVRVKPVNPRAAKVRPYFPGYMFVQFDLEELGSDALEWTPGARGLVRFGGEPALVPENLIQELKSHLAALAMLDPAAGPQYEKGDRVRIVSGLFEGYEALFDMRLADGDRVQILLKYLSEQYRRVKIDSSSIEKIGS